MKLGGLLKHAIFAILIGVVIFLTYVSVYVGAFREVKISETQTPPFLLLGKEHIGPYHKIVPVIQEVEAWAKSNRIDCSHSFGLYRMDPHEAEEERLRSFGGCWISDVDAKRLSTEGKREIVLPTGFKIETWSAAHFVKVDFDGSPGVGPIKVYPKVEDYIEEKRLKRRAGTLEVYVIAPDAKAMTTTYYFPVE